MNKSPTLKQLVKAFRAGDGREEVSSSDLQSAIESGLLGDLFEATRLKKLGGVDRVEFRAMFYIYNILNGHFDTVRLMACLQNDLDFVVDERINAALMVINPYSGETTPGTDSERKIVLIHLDKDECSLSEATKKAGEMGLLIPNPHSALWFGIEHSDVQAQFPIIFPHKPFQIASDERDQVLWLNMDGDGRKTLDLSPCELEAPFLFGREFRYAFLKP